MCSDGFQGLLCGSCVSGIFDGIQRRCISFEISCTDRIIAKDTSLLSVLCIVLPIVLFRTLRYRWDKRRVRNDTLGEADNGKASSIITRSVQLISEEMKRHRIQSNAQEDTMTPSRGEHASSLEESIYIKEALQDSDDLTDYSNEFLSQTNCLQFLFLLKIAVSFFQVASMHPTYIHSSSCLITFILVTYFFPHCI